MRKLLAMLLCVVLAATSVSAQNRALKGRVTDDKGNPVANVTVTVKNTTVGTTTNAAGEFSLNVTSSAKTLVFRSIGYATEEVSITSSTTYGVSMKPVAESLDEVVVTGYTREKKSTFAGAASVIGGKAVEAVPVGSFDQALQGRAPGVLVNSGSGQPGSSANVTIRGISSINAAGSQPLYVIDGIPLPSGDFATLNPDDFESLTVLKDASAAALYGARGGLGVIVITTKKGKAGATNFAFKTQFGFTQKPDFSRLNQMNTKEMLSYEEREKIPTTPGWVYSPLNPAIPLGMTAATKAAALDSISRIDIDYTNYMYRQGLSSTNEVSMSGGSDRTRFYVNLGTFQQNGIDINSSLKRYTLRFNLDHSTDKVSVQFNTTAGYSLTKLSEGEVRGSSTLSAFQMTFRAKTYENPYKPNGSLNFGSSNSLALKQIANLLEAAQNSSRGNNQIKLNSGLTVAYKILPSLTLKNTLGIDVSSLYSNRYINANSYIGLLQTFNSGLTQEGNLVSTQIINTASLTFAKKIAERHDMEVAGFFETVRGYQRAQGFTLYNLDPRLTETGREATGLPVTSLNGGSTYPQNASSAKNGFGIRSFFGMVRYTYNDKYTLTGNARMDGTSRIANPDNREIFTWSAGFIWNTMKENFMRNSNVFSDFRVRMSYGSVPNIGSIATGSYGVGLNSISNYANQQIPTFGTTTYIGSSTSGQAPVTPGNYALRIEKIEKYNLGVDFAVWRNRARFSVEAYYNKTRDLFATQILSATTGFYNYGLPLNAGSMRNQGLEVTASVDVVKTRDWTVTAGWNHSFNRNKILSLGSVNEFVQGTSIIRVGLPFGSSYATSYLGADPATGAPRFTTPDGKGETFDPGKAGQFAYGSYLPVHQGGFNLDVRYKAFSLSALLSYQFDVWRYDNTYNWITRGISGYQSIVRGSRDLLTQQWTKAGDNKFFQSSAYDRGFSSADVFDAKFLRLRNVMLAYQIPAIKAGSTTVLKSSRFYIMAQNLAIWSPWKGLDPEDSNNISLTEYPNPKYFVVGLDINF